MDELKRKRLMKAYKEQVALLEQNRDKLKSERPEGFHPVRMFQWNREYAAVTRELIKVYNKLTDLLVEQLVWMIDNRS